MAASPICLRAWANSREAAIKCFEFLYDADGFPNQRVRRSACAACVRLRLVWGVMRSVM